MPFPRDRDNRSYDHGAHTDILKTSGTCDSTGPALFLLTVVFLRQLCFVSKIVVVFLSSALYNRIKGNLIGPIVF